MPMARVMFARSLAAALLLAAGSCATPPVPEANPPVQQVRWTSACKVWDEWSKPGPPFNIYGNTWYVGTCGISSILVAGTKGAIVIDGGPADAGGLIASNIVALGFKLSDVKILLHTHEHHDHVGGLAELKRLTHARLIASEGAAPTLESGMPSAADPQFADHHGFPPVKVNGTVKDGEEITRGNLALKAIATPGHTPGAMSWQWRSCEGNVCKTIVYADSMTPVSSEDYRFSDHPETVAALRKSYARVAALDCDILLSPHPSASHMRDRLLKGSLTDPDACKVYAAGLEKQLDERLAKEAAGTSE